ncbi:FDLD family class I lanthipeptide, partial [Paenibacillus sp. FSL R7-269]
MYIITFGYILFLKKRGGVNMKNNLFDLDVQVNKTTVSSVQPNVTSIV